MIEGILLLWDPAVRAVLDLGIFLDAPERVRLERRLAATSPSGAGRRRPC